MGAASLFQLRTLRMVQSWFFAPSAIIEHVRINLDSPLYEVYVFHGSKDGKCNLNGKAKYTLSVSLLPDKSPDVRDEPNWIRITKNCASNFFTVDQIDDINRDGGGYLYRHLLTRVDLTDLFYKNRHVLVDEVTGKQKMKYLAIRVQFKHNVNN